MGLHVFEFLAGHAPLMTMVSVASAILAGGFAKYKKMVFASMAATIPSLALYLDLASDAFGGRELIVRILASSLYIPTLLLTPIVLCAGLLRLRTKADDTVEVFESRFFTVTVVLQWTLYVFQEFSLNEMVSPINASLS